MRETWWATTRATPRDPDSFLQDRPAGVGLPLDGELGVAFLQHHPVLPQGSGQANRTPPGPAEGKRCGAEQDGEE